MTDVVMRQSDDRYSKCDSLMTSLYCKCGSLIINTLSVAERDCDIYSKRGGLMTDALGMSV